MYELMQMSGQEYVDLYAADVKVALRAGQPGPTHAARPDADLGRWLGRGVGRRDVGVRP